MLGHPYSHSEAPTAMTDLPEDVVESMRKTPRQARAWATCRTIFAATLQLLDRGGEQGLTTNRVAERAGFSVGTLYQYFPNMEAVLAAMIDLERRRVLAGLDRLLSRAETEQAHPLDVLREVVAYLLANFGLGGGARRILLRRAWRHDHLPPVVALVQAGAARIRLFIARRAHPAFPVPDEAALFAATRAVLGTIRAAVLEDSPLLGRPEFEEMLVRLALGPLTAGPR